MATSAQSQFYANLKKYYTFYTGGFITFVIIVGILEQLGVPTKVLGYIFLFATILLYAGIGFMSKTAEVAEYYVAGRRVPALFNGMATGADWMSAASFIGMAGTLYLTGFDGLAFVLGWTGGYCLVAFLLAPYLRILLDQAASNSLDVAALLHLDAGFLQTATEVTQALAVLRDGHALHQAYLKVSGRPVIFFYQQSRLSLPAWPAFMVMIFFFVVHEDTKQAPHILIGGLTGIICMVLCEMFIEALHPMLGHEAAKLLFIGLFVYAIVLLQHAIPYVFNAFAFMFFLVSAIALPTAKVSPYVWMAVELLFGGIFILGILGINRLVNALLKNDEAKA